MKTPYYIFALISLSICLWTKANAQNIIASFSWDDPTKPVTEADYGTNAVSASSKATISAGGSNNSGLNAGDNSPKTDIDMDFPVSAEFDQPGMDFTIDFRRKESRASFLSRSGFDFGVSGGSLQVTFTVDNGSGGSTTVSSGPQYTVPNDDTWRTYRFYYLNQTGQAEMRVNGTTVWTYSGVPNRDLVWQADAFRLGGVADGNGNDVAIFDNLVIGQTFNSALPVELVDFSLTMYNVEQVDLTWTTATEINNDRFEIEKSYDGVNWEKIHTEYGAGNSQVVLNYTFTDYDASAPIQYYRLRQIDFDGQETLSSIISYQRDEKFDLKLFPNPTERYVYIEAEDLDFTVIRLSDMSGRYFDLSLENLSHRRMRVDLSEFPSGQYTLHVGEVSNTIVLV